MAGSGWEINRQYSSQERSRSAAAARPRSRSRRPPALCTQHCCGTSHNESRVKILCLMRSSSCAVRKNDSEFEICISYTS